MTVKKKTTKSTTERAVLVTTEHRGVFFGYASVAEVTPAAVEAWEKAPWHS